MKKILLLALLAIVSVSAFARKSYITVASHPYSGDDYWTMKLSGDVPSDIPNITPAGSGNDDEDDGYWTSKSYSIGQMLNLLSEYGYEIEFIAPISDNNHSFVQYILSKETSTNPTGKNGDVNKDGKVNVSDVNIILGIVRDNPSLLEQSR